MRIIPHRSRSRHTGKPSAFVKFRFPLNFVTAPLIADLFLLAILAIGRQEVHDGTIGANNIAPYDIMIFFLTLAYIAISVDASGLIRYLAFKVLQKGGKVGHQLFFYLYAFFFGLGAFIGNDPIILSGTAFLAYMTRVSSNIKHPGAWIHSQFAIANIASAILVSSNPTNLVLAGAFEIKFIVYTANMIVPVVATAVVLFPFLLYIIFADETLIPLSIDMHKLEGPAKDKTPVNPNIPNARGIAEEEEEADSDEGKQLSLEEILNPFLDKKGAAFGALIMAATLIAVLAINASSQNDEEHPVYWVTLPAAFVMFCWDVGFGWLHRHETREIAAKGRKEVEDARAQKEARERDEKELKTVDSSPEIMALSLKMRNRGENADDDASPSSPEDSTGSKTPHSDNGAPLSATTLVDKEKFPELQPYSGVTVNNNKELALAASPEALDTKHVTDTNDVEKYSQSSKEEPSTLVSLSADFYRWLQETFPTVTAVVSHMPFPLVPFAFSMFVLVQALVTKGWVPVFAHGWNHWVNKTGTVGAIGGMGFLSVILCNVSS